MAEPENDQTELTPSQQLTQALAKLPARTQAPLQNQNYPAPPREWWTDEPVEEEKSWFGSALDTATGVFTKPIGWLFDGLEIARSQGSLKFYESFGPKNTAEDRAIRQRLENTRIFDVIERTKINRDRPAMWTGEKLMSDIAFDPLTYIGFGLMGRIPLAGKFLGPLEQAYMSMVNRTVLGAVKVASRVGSIPIQMLARASTIGLGQAVKSGKIDDASARLITGQTFWSNQSMGIKTSRIRDTTTEGVMAVIELISGLGARNLDDPAVTAQAVKAVMSVSRGKLQEQGFDGAVILRDALETSHLSKRVLENQDWVKEAANGLYGSNRLTPDMYQKVTDTVDAFFRGDYGFDYTVAELVSSLGLSNLREDIVTNVSVWLTKTKLGQEAFIESISSMVPREAAEFLGGQAAKRAGDDIVNGINQLRSIQGYWGGFLSRATAIYGTVWRNGIDKFMMRPMSEAVLASPAYPVGNLFEDIYFVGSGGATPSLANVDEFNKVFQGVADVTMARLRKEGRLGVGTRDLGPLATEITDQVDSKGNVIGKQWGQAWIPTTGRLAWFGRKWMDISTKLSEMMRRGFWISRQESNLHKFSSATATKDFDNYLPAYRELLDFINAPPLTSAGSEELTENISQAVRMYAASGNPNAIRHIAERFTAPNIRKAQMLNELALYTDLSPVTRNIIRSAINSGDFSRITGVAIDHALDAEMRMLGNRAEAQAEWFDNIIATLKSEDITNGADIVATMLSFNRAMHQAQLLMHSNMAATFEEVGTRFGAVEREAFKKAYENAIELGKVLDSKVPLVADAYEQAARKAGIPVYESRDNAIKLQQLSSEFWKRDIEAHAGFFERGGTALEWRITRQQLWAPMQEQYARSMEAAQESLLMDVIRGLQDGPVSAQEVLERLNTLPLSKVVQHPAGYNQTWYERKTSLEHLRTRLGQMADEVPITDLESDNLRKYGDFIADQIDTAPRDTYPVLAKPKGKLDNYFLDEAGEPIVIYRGTTGGQTTREGHVVGGVGGVARGTVDVENLPWGKGVLHATPDRELATTFGDNVQAFYVKGTQRPRARLGQPQGLLMAEQLPETQFGKASTLFDMDGLASDIPESALKQMQNDLFLYGEEIDDLYDSAGLLFEQYAQRFGQADAITVLKEHGVKVLKSTDPLDEIGILDDTILEAIPGTSRGHRAVSAVKQPTELGQKFRVDWDRAIDRTRQESHLAFTNYDDQDGLDFVMKHFFPFWSYAKNIWPRLAATGIQHPMANTIAGPNGHYWQNTDMGYIPYPIGGVRIAAYRGLGVNRIINIAREQFPSRQEGFMGEFEDEVVDRAVHWGFYPGFPWQLAGSVATNMYGDGSVEWGTHTPPLYQFLLESAMATGAAANISGTEKIYHSIDLGRFNEARERRVAFSMGLDPLNLSDEDKRRVIARVGAFNALNNAITMFQLRPDFYKEYQEANLETLALVANVDVETIKSLNELEPGDRYFERYPLTPNQRQDLRSIMAKTYGKIVGDYMAVNEPYKSDKDRELSINLRTYFDTHDNLKIAQAYKQVMDDEGLLNGKTPHNVWRTNLANRSLERRNLRQFVMAGLGLTDEDMDKQNPSIIDILIDDYYSVDLDVYRQDYTGYINYEEVELERMGRIHTRLAEYEGNSELALAEFTEYRLQNESDVITKFKLGGYKGFYDWFNKDKAIEWYAADDVEMLNSLVTLEQDIFEADIEQRKAIAGGEPQVVATAIGRVPGDWQIARVMAMFQQHLLTQNPDIEEWLRLFYNIIPRGR